MRKTFGRELVKTVARVLVRGMRSRRSSWFLGGSCPFGRRPPFDEKENGRPLFSFSRGLRGIGTQKKRGLAAPDSPQYDPFSSVSASERRTRPIVAEMSPAMIARSLSSSSNSSAHNP
ncbi:hypothetical protein Cdeb_00965 [Caldibacillus debilis GB1]|uniref:Uncharacterized protein n=1 Tax=Caldibacillus debilis GB1 TaxID=1339248 RepID=A0A420VF39_9BACI|nr:hypothetical protein Cdeb_00965 [Caldibacillus debilis GB1]